MRTNFRLSLVFFTGALLAPLLAFPQAKEVVRDSQHNVSISPVPAVHSETLTLVRTRDYSGSLGTVDCPNCKDLTCASFGPSVAGAKITSVEFIRMRSKGHWYRCQVQAQCGVPEFSDPVDPHRGCEGLTSCKVCRATDDGTQAEDDIQVSSQ